MNRNLAKLEFINNTFLLKKGEFHFRQLIESLNLDQKWQGITKSAGKNSVSLATLMFLNFKVIFSWSFLGGGVIVAAIIMEVTSLFQSDESKNH